MKVIVLQAVVLLSLAGVASVLTWKFHPRAPALRLNEEPLGDGEISIDVALGWEQSQGVLWIDARSVEKFEEQHIPGAILLNEFDWNALLMENYHVITNQDRPLVIYCGSYSCKASTTIADKLRAIRVPDVYVLKGGWDAWLTRR